MKRGSQSAPPDSIVCKVCPPLPKARALHYPHPSPQPKKILCFDKNVWVKSICLLCNGLGFTELCSLYTKRICETVAYYNNFHESRLKNLTSLFVNYRRRK